MKSLTRTLLIGFSILLPVLLSIQMLIWLVRSIEAWLRPLWLAVVPESFYFPGMAVIGLLLVSLLAGYCTKLPYIRELLKIPGMVMERIPLVGYFYNTIKDFLDLMAGKAFTDQSVVWVNMPDSDARLMGIVTKKGGEKGSRLSGMMKDDEVAVYLPMSYQAGGYMLVMPRDQVEKADVSPGEALQMIMSAGLGQGGGGSKKSG